MSAEPVNHEQPQTDASLLPESAVRFRPQPHSVGEAESDKSRTRFWTITPLRWKKSFEDWRQSYSTYTIFGSLNVERTREDCDETKPWGSWKWEYCFDEYYNEGSSECETAAEGKRLAEVHWQECISHALTEARP